MAISALPPKAKITAEVCSGRSRPKVVHEAEVERREGELEGDERAQPEADDAPEHGGDGEPPDHVLVVVDGAARRPLRYRSHLAPRPWIRPATWRAGRSRGRVRPAP